jgi:hypothetical protein
VRCRCIEACPNSFIHHTPKQIAILAIVSLTTNIVFGANYMSVGPQNGPNSSWACFKRLSHCFGQGTTFICPSTHICKKDLPTFPLEATNGIAWATPTYLELIFWNVLFLEYSTKSIFKNYSILIILALKICQKYVI